MDRRSCRWRRAEAFESSGAMRHCRRGERPHGDLAGFHPAPSSSRQAALRQRGRPFLRPDLRAAQVGQRIEPRCRGLLALSNARWGGRSSLSGSANPVHGPAIDVGLADPRALQISSAAAATCEREDRQDGELALCQAVIYLAAADKSNASATAFMQARAYVAQHRDLEFPAQMRRHAEDESPAEPQTLLPGADADSPLVSARPQRTGGRDRERNGALGGAGARDPQRWLTSTRSGQSRSRAFRKIPNVIMIEPTMCFPLCSCGVRISKAPLTTSAA